MVDLEKDEQMQNSSIGIGGESAVASSTTLPTEKNNVDDAGYANHEHSFDSGWAAWSQVLASFFLFFNTWYDAFYIYKNRHRTRNTNFVI